MRANVVRLAAVAVLLGVVTGTAAPLQTAASEAAAEPNALVAQFLSRAEVPLERYTGRRVMRARNARLSHEAWLEAVTRMDPAAGFAYEVVASGGSSFIISRVLVPALRREADLWRDRDPERYALTTENYQFAGAAPGADGQDEVSVAIVPRRRHLLLVEGVLYLASDDAELRRIEGRLSKSPSFWVSRVDVVRRYARIAGVRVPVEFESVAHVRIAGRSEMQIVYLYESINGQAVTGAGMADALARMISSYNSK